MALTANSDGNASGRFTKTAMETRADDLLYHLEFLRAQSKLRLKEIKGVAVQRHIQPVVKLKLNRDAL